MMPPCYLAMPLRDAPASQPLKLVALFQARFALRLWVIAIAVLHFNRRYNLQVPIFSAQKHWCPSNSSHLDVTMKAQRHYFWLCYISCFIGSNSLVVHDLSCCSSLAFSLLYLVEKFHHWEYFFPIFFPQEVLFVKLKKGMSLCFHVTLLIWCSFDTRVYLSVFLNASALLMT